MGTADNGRPEIGARAVNWLPARKDRCPSLNRGCTNFNLRIQLALGAQRAHFGRHIIRRADHYIFSLFHQSGEENILDLV